MHWFPREKYDKSSVEWADEEKHFVSPPSSLHMSKSFHLTSNIHTWLRHTRVTCVHPLALT